jgi:hypothetical protein
VADEQIIPEVRLAGPELLTAGRTASIGAALLVAAFGVFGFANLVPASQGDRISGAESARLADNYRAARGTLLPVDVSDRDRKAELLRVLPIPRMQAERLMAMVESGERMLGWLTLWDNFDEDGDVVSVSAAGFTQSVALRHVPVRILVPYVPGQPVFLTGERDGGGGGVTAAVELSSGPLPLPPLAVGQTVALPLQ